MVNECKLTTVDNPFDPFEQFDSWLLFDMEKGYNTCSLLARIVKVSDDFSEKEIEEEVERAIDEIIKYDFTNKYKKVKRVIKEDTDEESEKQLNNDEVIE